MCKLKQILSYIPIKGTGKAIMAILEKFNLSASYIKMMNCLECQHYDEVEIICSMDKLKNFEIIGLRRK